MRAVPGQPGPLVMLGGITLITSPEALTVTSIMHLSSLGSESTAIETTPGVLDTYDQLRSWSGLSEADDCCEIHFSAALVVRIEDAGGGAATLVLRNQKECASVGGQAMRLAGHLKIATDAAHGGVAWGSAVCFMQGCAHRRFCQDPHRRRRPACNSTGKVRHMPNNGFQGLVMDIGVSEGNDTAYYLAKGFRVIAVEADPAAYQALRVRFQAEIQRNALILLNLAASDTFGGFLEFFAHKVHQGISGVSKRAEVADDYIRHFVMTIDWRTLLAQAGLPRYVKIDIEGSEVPFLRGMLREGRVPEFISVECYKFRATEMLHEAGYSRFRLVDQNPLGGFQLPDRQLEGSSVKKADFKNASGPFGLDIFADGDWMDFDSFKLAWKDAERKFNRTWFDCHAWDPN
jgi:FkbM family methyltransferase